MGAMLKVKQKLQAKSREGADGSPEPPVDASSSPVREAGTSPTSDPAYSTPQEGPSSFVPGSVEAPRAADEVLNDETISWNANRLDKALVTFHERHSAISEQYRSLRARLLNMNPQNTRQVLAITSSLPQEGKSVTTINLGMVMAEGSEHQIVIADADFRRASIARMLGIAPEPGLAELIRGSAKLSEVLRPTQFPNLKVITAGATTDRNCGELVGTSAAKTVLGKLRETFDYAFLDTPPVNTVSDVSMLAPHCDGAIIVIEMQRTPEPTAQEAVRSLQTTNVKILGCILSRYRNPRGYYYERYYGYYYTNND